MVYIYTLRFFPTLKFYGKEAMNCWINIFKEAGQNRIEGTRGEVSLSEEDKYLFLDQRKGEIL